MARATGPLMSMSASGSIAGAITFGSWKGRPVVRRHAIPSNPSTASQVAVRAMMRFLSQNWANLDATEKATWDAAAESDAIAPINAFQRHNANRFTQFQFPLVATTEAAGTAPVMGTLTVTGGVGQLSLSQVITTLSDIWGVVFAASTSTGFTPVRTNVRYVAYGIASPITAVLTGLTPGNWFVRAAGFNRGGTTSAFITEVSGTVT